MSMKIFYAVLGLILSCSNVSVRADELHEAIMKINIARVRELLSKKEHFDQDEKKRLEKFAHAVTKDAKFKTKSIWRSGEDTARVLFGYTFISGGILGGLYGISQAKKSPALLVGSLAGAIAAVWFGKNQLSKGRHLYSARQWHKKARQVESLIAHKPVHHNG
jgi:hypothetical protein